MCRKNKLMMCSMGAILLVMVVIGFMMFRAHIKESHLKFRLQIAEDSARHCDWELEQAQEKARDMREKLERLAQLFMKDRLLYSAKEESRQLFEDLQEYWGDDLPMEYDEATGKVKGLWVLDQYGTIQATPALTNARKLEKERLLELNEKAYNAAKEVTEAQFEYGKYMSSK